MSHQRLPGALSAPPAGAGDLPWTTGLHEQHQAKNPQSPLLCLDMRAGFVLAGAEYTTRLAGMHKYRWMGCGGQSHHRVVEPIDIKFY